MEIEKEINKRKELQSLILNFIDNEDDDDDNFQTLTKFINDNNISKTKIDLQDFLHLLIKIADNYYRGIDFFSKIIKVVNFLLPDIRSFYKDQAIYQMFCQNKILILNLIQNNSIVLDEWMINDFQYLYTYQSLSNKRLLAPYNILFLYLYYKSTNDTQNMEQIKELIKSKINMDIEQLIQLCQKGENEHQICQLIRQDSLNDFIYYINKENIKQNSQIPFSVFETNDFLLKNNITLINYASFYGSIQIFKYLLKSEVQIDSTLLESAVHGRNPEIIHMIEDNLGDNFKKVNNPYGFGMSKNIQELKNKMKGPVDALIESIKCFHNDIANNFEQNGCNVNDENDLQKIIISSGFEYNNYEFIPNNFDLLFPFSRYMNLQYRRSDLEDAFSIFYTLTEMTVPSSVTKIPDLCFLKLVNLNKVVISSSVTEIGVGSFVGCSSLKEVSLPSSLESIGKNAFANCSSLKQISIPSSLKSIGDYAFSKCTSLMKIIIKENSSLVSIGKRSFANCTSLSQIFIPSSLMLIDEKSFKNCKSLSVVSFEEPCSLKSICKSVFAYCSSLTSLIIPTSVTSIEDNAFLNCSSLKQISIPSSMTSIGVCSFRECTSLEKISIPDSVKSIGRCAFDSCKLLVQVSFPSSLTSIGDYLFENCSSLKQIFIPSSVTSIGDYPFSKCTSLEQVSIPSSVTKIGTGSFKQCTSLVQVSIPSSVTLIGDHTFEGCSSLKQIEIPSSVKSIGDYSFRNCTSLEKVSISSSETKIGDFVFCGCKSLPKSEIPINYKNKSSDQSNKDEIHEYFRNRKDLYNCIFDYLESSDEIGDHLLEMIHKIKENEYDLIELLNLLSSLSVEASSTSIIKKIVQILDICKEKIQQKISSNKLCYIFKKNIRILQYLGNNNLLKLDKATFDIILNANNGYVDKEIYFFNLLSKNSTSFHQNKDDLESTNQDEEDEEKRKTGENHSKISKIIRNDSIDEFISQLKEIEKDKVNNNIIFNINNQRVPRSLYETNPLLNNERCIKYAAFHGATKIFNYLFYKEFDDDDDDNDNTFSMNPYSNMNPNKNAKVREKHIIWQYAIHGRQQEILHILDKNGFEPENENQNNQNVFSSNGIQYEILNIQNCFEIAIQFHENEIARNLIKNNKIETDYLNAIQNYNFEFIEDFYNKFEDNISFLLFYTCYYDYPQFVHLLITTRNIDLNTLSDKYTINYFSALSDKINIIDAAIKSNNEIINFLIKTQQNIEFDGDLLIDVMQKNNKELLRAMLSQPNLDVNAISHVNIEYCDEHLNDISPLFLAIINRDIEIISLLLNHPNINVNQSFEPNTSRTTYRTALHIAIEMEYIPAIKLLLEKPEIDVNAIANIDEESFNFQNWSTKNFDFYYTPLHEAVELKNIEIIKLLLAHPNIDVNKIEVYENYEGKHKWKFDRVKQSVLCRAIQMQNLEIVQLLLQHPGIDVNKKAIFHQNDTDDNHNNNNDDGDDDKEEEENQGQNNFMYEDEDPTIIVRRTPLQFAYAGTSKEIIQLLLDRKDIKSTHAKRKDVLIKMFTRDINPDYRNNEKFDDKNIEINEE